MKKSTTNNTSREVIFTESKTMREEYVKEEYYDILDKIKAIPYMTKDMVVSIEQVANYYEVTKKAIETVIKRNKDEIESDGYMVLKGEELKDFKNKICLLHGEGNKIISNKTQTFSILTKRAMLRIGMLLTTSEIAKQVRTHLLNCEEEVSQEKQIWLAQREAGKIDRKRMTTAIKNYIPDSPHKKFKYPQYTNLVYKILFNKDAKTMRKERGFTKNDALRDSFTGEELKLVDEAETIVTALVTLGFGYDYIKQQLSNKYNKLIKDKEQLEIIK